jgi:ABC-2 type transport system permease protein
MKALWFMFVANLKMNYRNRMALFWNLAFPAIFIFLFGFLFTNFDFSVDIGVAGVDVSPVAQRVTDEMEQTSGFSVTTGSQQDELAALEDGDRMVVVVFTPGATPEQLNATVYYDSTEPQESQIALSAVQQFLAQVNVESLGEAKPIEVSVSEVASTELRYIDFLVPGIIAMSLMNSGVIALASAFVSYREKGILRRIKATPFPLSSFITARILSQLVVAVVQTTMLLLLGMLLFDLQIDGSLISVYVVVIIGSLAFLSLGFVISSFARNQEAADALANAVVFPMLFLSGVFFPVDAAPEWLGPITKLLPLRYLVDAMRGVMVEGATLASEWFNLSVLIVTGLVCLFIATRLFRWESSAT